MKLTRFSVHPLRRLAAVLLIPVHLFSLWPVQNCLAQSVSAQAVVPGVTPSAPVPIPGAATLPPSPVSNTPATPVFRQSSPPTLSAQPSLAEIAGSRLLAHPLVPIGKGDPSEGERHAVAQALTTFSQPGSDPENTVAIEQFLHAYPNSAFRTALLTNLGLIYRRHGYWSKALDAWQQAWQAGKDESDPTKRLVVDQALAELAELTARIGRVDELKALLADAGDRAVRGPAAEKYSSAKASLYLMQNEPTKSYRCGPFAVGEVFHALHPDKSLGGQLHDSVSTDHGTSLVMVAEFARKLGLDYQLAFRSPGAAVLVPSVVNWKVGHYAALTREIDGRYLVEDPTFTDNCVVSTQALDQEGSGYYMVRAGILPAGWRKVSNDEGQKVWGRGAVTPNTPPTPPKKSRCHHGMADYDLDMSRVNLFINDTPYFYDLPRGPAMEFTASYSQRDSSPISVSQYSNLGVQWNFNWVAFIVDDPGNSTTKSYGPGGGVLKYTGYGTVPSAPNAFVPQTETQAVLQRTTPSGYLRTFPDGSKQIFGQGYTISGTTYYFMTESDDPAGNKVTYTYDPTYCRLLSVTDTLGQQVTLTYVNANDPTTGDYYRVSQVQDSTGRCATFTYNSLSQLSAITDMAGMTSQFSYNASDLITKLTTPYGDTAFDETDYPNLDRSIVITDPQGARECVMFKYGGAPPDQGAPVPSATGLTTDPNQAERNSYYWDKKAFADGAGDYSKAHLYHWMEVPGGGACSDLMESEKPALESRIYYNYLRQQNAYYLGDSGLPIRQARVLVNGSSNVTQLAQYDYNNQGKFTKTVDASTPARITTYQYAANGIDLTGVYQQNSAGTSTDSYGQPADLLRSMFYNTQGKHLVVQSTDASGQSNYYTYNSFGQLLTVTNAKGETTALTYDRNQAGVTGETDGYLQSVSVPAIGTPTQLAYQFGYDSFGRLAQTTDSEGYTVGIGYDAVGGVAAKTLNRVAKRTYPDGTYEEVDYDRMEPQWTCDRLGRWTELLHDKLRHLTGVIDPMNRLTQYQYCSCGSLEAIIDPAGNTTTWMRDAESRVTSKIYPDHSVWLTTYEPSTSRVQSTTDAKGQRTNYTYNLDDSLQQITYTDTSGNALVPSTPSVSYTYDSVYLRLNTMIDGIGTTQYTYNDITGTARLGAGKLASTSGPFASSAITFSYDELGRMNNQSINGSANNSGFTYDTLGRLHTISNVLSNSLPPFTYNYFNNTPRLDNTSLPNGQVTQYTYFKGKSDPRLKTIANKDSSGGVISQFDYTYSTVGDILSWTQNNPGLNHPQQYQFGYDADSELTSANLQDTVSGSILSMQAYDYDAAMNRISVQNGNSVTKETPNNLNQLTQTSGGGLMRFAGTVSKPSTVTVGDNPATVRADNSYEGWAQVNGTGTTQVHIVAKDSSGNVTDKYASATPDAVTVQSFIYDPNGNQTIDGPAISRVIYGWDASNRLVSINQGGHTTRFDYDGINRRMRESFDGIEVKHWIWIGLNMAEERDADNNVIKRFFAQGEQINGQPYLYTRDHLGSVRELVDKVQAVRARYNYDLYGLRSSNLIATNQFDADFGFSSHYFHQSSGLYLVTYRAYDPKIGRWLSRDLSGERGGINLYAYVVGNPVNLWDPNGMAPQAYPPPQYANGVPKPPPYPLPPGKEGQPNEWVPSKSDPNNPWHPYYKPKFPVPGGQPRCAWDPYDGHWQYDDGKGSPRQHADADGNPVDTNNNPLYGPPTQTANPPPPITDTPDSPFSPFIPIITGVGADELILFLLL